MKLWAEKIGVNTTSTDADLEINNASGGKLRLTYNDPNGSAATYSDLQVNSSGNMAIIPSGGNVGIGTTTPTNKLNVVGDINASTNLFVGGYAKLTTTDSPSTCAAGLTGALYFDTSLAKLCYCNGTNWCKVADDTCTSSTSCG